MFYFCLEKPPVIPKEIICFYVWLTYIQCNPHSVKRKKRHRKRRLFNCDQVIGTGGRGGGLCQVIWELTLWRDAVPVSKTLNFIQWIKYQDEDLSRLKIKSFQLGNLEKNKKSPIVLQVAVGVSSELAIHRLIVGFLLGDQGRGCCTSSRAVVNGRLGG